ncbi:MAG: NERD domain-containing protein [Actinomycetota bacterium]
MADPAEEYFVTIDESLVGRRPGGSAADKARELRRSDRLGTLKSFLLREHTDERAWRKGANGERGAAFFFDRMPEGWYIFHDIPVGDRGANIDHVIAGPAGVFTVNTKNLSGKVWVGPRTLLHNGHATSYLPKAAHEAERASRLLTARLGRPVPVKGVLAIFADDWTIKQKPEDVHVGSPTGVRKWLLGQPATLTSREVLEIAGAVSKPDTWTGRAAPRTETRTADATIAGDPCPCGGTFVERERRSDGAPFLGCSTFPRCRNKRSLAAS